LFPLCEDGMNVLVHVLASVRFVKRTVI